MKLEGSAFDPLRSATLPAVTPDVLGSATCAARVRPRRESLCYSVVAPTGDPGSYQSNDGPPGRPDARDNDTGGRR
jgi:hypothetical protein